MSFPLVCWFFAAAVTVHNAEEALFLPQWSHLARHRRHPVDGREFRFAVGVLTGLAYALAYVSGISGKESVGAYLIAGYALAMLINVFLPHLVATLVMRRYVPGTATGLLFNFPVTALLLCQAFQQGYVRLHVFMWAGPLVVAAVLGSLPLLLAVGRYCFSARKVRSYAVSKKSIDGAA
jgi:Protein of unknown function with HXXEE motif